MKTARWAILVTLLAIGAYPALAQMIAPVRSGYVHYIEGTVFLDNQLIPEPITGQFPKMEEGSVIRTEQGRAEVLMNPGVTLRLAEDSSARLVMNPFADTRVELIKGSGSVQVIERLKDTNFSLGIGAAQIVFDKAGYVHVDAEPGRIRVYSGQVNVRLDGKLFEVSDGKMLEFANGASAQIQGFDKKQTEALDRWSMRRGEVLAEANAAAVRGGAGSNANCFIGQPCTPGWVYNNRYGMMVYIPLGAALCDPYFGVCYYNPQGMIQARRQPPVLTPGAGLPSPNIGAVPTSTGYSGAGAVSNTTLSSPSAGVGSSAGAAASSSSVGQGSAATNRGR